MSTQYILGKRGPKGLLPGYDKQLRTQGGAFAKQLLEGCWRAFEGQYFDIWDPRRMVVARQSIHDDWWWTFWTGSDYGRLRRFASLLPKMLCLDRLPVVLGLDNSVGLAHSIANRVEGVGRPVELNVGMPR